MSTATSGMAVLARNLHSRTVSVGRPNHDKASNFGVYRFLEPIISRDICTCITVCSRWLGPEDEENLYVLMAAQLRMALYTNLSGHKKFTRLFADTVCCATLDES